MEYLVTAAVVISHSLATIPFWTKLLRGKLPATVDFACISVALFYDVGLVMEALHFEYQNAYILSFFSAYDDIIFLGTVFLILTPWLFRFGSYLAHSKDELQPLEQVSSLEPSRRTVFYVFAGLVSLYLAYQGYLAVAQGDPLWSVRAATGSDFGPLIIVLYLPISLLAFYVSQSDSRTIWG